MQIPSHWDEKHLICFLYISVTVSDFIVTNEETFVLNRNLEELLKVRYKLSETDSLNLLSDVSSFPIANDGERMAAIQLMSDKIHLDWDTYQYVVTELDEIAHSDKYVSVEEHSLMFYFRLKFKKDYPVR